MLGRPVAEVDALAYRRAEGRGCWSVALDALAELRARYDVVVCEGAGSPAEINLRAERHRQHGPGPRRATCRSSWSATSTAAGSSPRCTARWRCWTPADQALVAGFVVNKFRGDAAAARTRAWTCCAALTGRPSSACCPGSDGLWLDVEDSLGARPRPRGPALPPYGDATCCGWRSSGCRGYRNFTDVDALAAEPGVLVRFADRARASWPTPTWWCCPAPGRPSPTWPGCGPPGLADAVAARAAAGRPVLGICGGYQMLGRARSTTTSSRGAGMVDGLGLLPAASGSARRRCWAARAAPRCGAAGRGVRDPPRAWSPSTVRRSRSSTAARVGRCGARRWHGALENDEFRRAFLAEVARVGRPGLRPRAGHRLRRRAGGAAGRAGRPGDRARWTPMPLLRLIEDGPPRRPAGAARAGSARAEQRAHVVGPGGRPSVVGGHVGGADGAAGPVPYAHGEDGR